MILALIQARDNSTRYPRKIYHNLEGQTMLQHVRSRVAKVIPNVQVARPTRGFDENDVLSRFMSYIILYPVYTIVRITADCPMWDSGMGQHWLDLYYQDDRPKYLHAIPAMATGPEWDGLDMEIIPRWYFERAYEEARDPYDREHVTTWMKRNLPWKTFSPPKESLRFSVDTLEDAQWVEEIFHVCVYCRDGVPHHTNAHSSIGGSGRYPIWDLHQVNDPTNKGGLEECRAYDLLKQRIGGPVYVSR